MSLVSQGVPFLLLVLILAGCAGLGDAATAAIKGCRYKPSTVAEQILVGFGLVSCFAGLASYVYIFTPALVIAMLAGGILCLVARQRSGMVATEITFAKWPARHRVILGGILLFWLYYPAVFNPYDDGSAYVVFPEKLLVFGGLGDEPFSQRRLFLLGGHFWAQAAVLSFCSLSRLSLVEPVLGMAMTVILTYSLAIKRMLPAWWTCPCLLLFLLWTYVRRDLGNTAPAFLLAPFLMALLVRAREGGTQERLQSGSVIAGLLLFAVASLRPTLVPAAILLIIVAATPLHFKVDKRAFFYQFFSSVLTSVSVAVIVSLPLMAVMRRSSGTFLYPFFGTGHQVAGNVHSLLSPGQHLYNIAAIAANDKLFIIATATAAFALWSAAESNRLRLGLCFAAVATGYAGIIVGSGGAGASRFTFPLLMAFVLSNLMDPAVANRIQNVLRRPIFQRFESNFVPAAWKAGVVIVPVALIVALALDIPQNISRAFSAKHRARLKDLNFDPELLRSSRIMQEQTPVGASILSTSLMNFRLDFKRNRVLINDLPGTAGPPPGWPKKADGDKLAAYLNARGVDYVALQKSLQNLLIHPPSAYLPQWTGTALEKLHVEGAVRFLGSLAQEPFASSVLWEDDRHVLYRVPRR